MGLCTYILRKGFFANSTPSSPYNIFRHVYPKQVRNELAQLCFIIPKILRYTPPLKPLRNLCLNPINKSFKSFHNKSSDLLSFKNCNIVRVLSYLYEVIIILQYSREQKTKQPNIIFAGVYLKRIPPVQFPTETISIPQLTHLLNSYILFCICQRTLK